MKPCCSCPGVGGEYVFGICIANLRRWIVSIHPSVLQLVIACRFTPAICTPRDKSEPLARRREQAERCLQRWRRRAVRRSRPGASAFIADNIESLSSILVSCQCESVVQEMQTCLCSGRSALAGCERFQRGSLHASFCAG